MSGAISFNCECGQRLHIPVGYSIENWTNRFIQCRRCGHKYNVEVEARIPRIGVLRDLGISKQKEQP